ncbi:MAG TPA: aminotransferase class V-fold PLP-dependent enzyme, partial [Candidatus Caenarcaniphilales bacterium]|nr:aminotransferase class V-fold PLP-dependent enzyme [Candidatus Caenarcaniphilales bacterium]
MVDPLLPDAEKVAALREALPATGAGIYLDTATRGPLPAETAAAMREADEWELRVGRATAGRSEDVEQRAEEARAVLAALVTAQPNEIALFPAVAVALSVAAWAPDWRPGDRVLTTSQDGPAVLSALTALRDRLAVEVDVVDVPDLAPPDALVAALDASMTARTRLVMVSHVTPDTGRRTPLEAVADIAHRHGAWL